MKSLACQHDMMHSKCSAGLGTYPSAPSWLIQHIYRLRSHPSFRTHSHCTASFNSLFKFTPARLPWASDHEDLYSAFLPRSHIQNSVSTKMKRQYHIVKKWEGLGEICYCCAINDNYYRRNVFQDARKQLVKKVKLMSHLSAHHQVAIVTKQLCILSEFFLTLLNGIC